MRLGAGIFAFAALFVACSSFTSPPETPVADGGVDAASDDAGSEAGPTCAGLSGDGFLVPLGAGGCACAPTAKYCNDFEGANDISPWANNVTAGEAPIGDDPSAPSPTHFAEAILLDTDITSACPYTRLYADDTGHDFGQLALEFGVKLGRVSGTDEAQNPTQFGSLGFSDGDNAHGETLYFGLTQSELLVHEQWSNGNGSLVDARHPFPVNVSRTDWIYVQVSVDFGAKQATLKVKGTPQSATFNLGQTAMGSRGKDYGYSIGFSCTPRGGDMGFDDIVLTYE